MRQSDAASATRFAVVSRAVRVLVVGTGGVGAAVAAVARAAATSSSGSCSRTSTRRGPERSPRRSATTASQPRRSTRRTRRRSRRVAREHGADAILNATDPRFNPPIFAGGVRRRLHYLDMAMTLSEPHPDGPTRCRRDARRRAVRRARAVGRARPARARRHGRRARALRRLRALRRRSPVLGDRRGRRPRRREPRRRGLRLRADLLDLDDDRGVPEPAARLGARPRLLHDRAVLRAGDLRVPRGHRRRSSA